MVLFGFLNLSETSITRCGSIISMIQIALDVRRNQSKAKYEKNTLQRTKRSSVDFFGYSWKFKCIHLTENSYFKAEFTYN